jgi:hypothetical protein
MSRTFTSVSLILHSSCRDQNRGPDLKLVI